ncbi:AraC family transcriptional regulator [Allorhizobium sp. BGMRC 0089]|uniref:helix-turn-helix domain-containing protein n=1 Tax=Allorhizobium sonneratiae TaxID=2934936 RepID=UPI0020337994|nr:AraC family transcriptional regulator [Allorhizobium sonneratiae]MCM2292964.1 AraC family transcriptional regulator [Allorhizobium sonneratiae]
MKQKFLKIKEGAELSFVSADELVFPPHSHDEYVISHNFSGHEKVKLDSKHFEAAEGTTTLYNPGQIQSSCGVRSILSVYLTTPYLTEAGIAARDIDFEVSVVNDPALAATFGVLRSLMEDDDCDSVSEQTNMILLQLLVRKNPLCADTKSHMGSARLTAAQAMLRDNLDQNVSLDALSKELGVTPLHLIRSFVKSCGVPPMTWQRIKRIEAARDLLRNGIAPTDVAYQVGFSDQAHLTRWFKRAYKITPAAFQK